MSLPSLLSALFLELSLDLGGSVELGATVAGTLIMARGEEGGEKGWEEGRTHVGAAAMSPKKMVGCGEGAGVY